MYSHSKDTTVFAGMYVTLPEHIYLLLFRDKTCVYSACSVIRTPWTISKIFKVNLYYLMVK